MVASSLPERAVSRAAPAVIAWVRLNREALLRFWDEGETFSIRDMTAFVQSLHKL